MKNWLKEPLLHFMILGGLIFGSYAWINGTQPNNQGSIVVSLRQQENLAKTFERTWQRPPTQAELNGLIVDFLRQEIAYRESQKMQLDRDDIVIRRRLRQKLEMLAEGVASMSPPTQEQLQEYLDKSTDKFRVPGITTFHQLYFNVDNSGASAAAERLLRSLTDDPASVDLGTVGDQSLLPPHMQNVRDVELDSLFGNGFADRIAAIDPGEWGGPVESGFGLHLVRIDERTTAYDPPLADVYDAVQREWLTVRRSEAIDGLYERLADNYSISIEASPQALPDDGESP